MSKFLEEFDIEEKPFSYLAEQYPNLIIKNKILEQLDTDKQVGDIENVSINSVLIIDYPLF